MSVCRMKNRHSPSQGMPSISIFIFCSLPVLTVLAISPSEDCTHEPLSVRLYVVFSPTMRTP